MSGANSNPKKHRGVSPTEGDATGPVADPEEQLSDDEEESEEDLDLGVDEAEKDRTDQLIFS